MQMISVETSIAKLLIILFLSYIAAPTYPEVQDADKQTIHSDLINPGKLKFSVRYDNKNFYLVNRILFN